MFLQSQSKNLKKSVIAFSNKEGLIISVENNLRLYSIFSLSESPFSMTFGFCYRK